VIVELDAFSGRPNPRWDLSEGDAKEVARLLAALEAAPGGPAFRSPGLGYRGFRLEGSDGVTYEAYRGLVQSRDRILADPDRSVERFLVAHMPSSLDGVRSWLEGEVAAE
jgi:hypothetical protein